MTITFNHHKSALIVGIEGGDQDETILRYAEQIARRSGCALHLSHVLEPWIPGPWHINDTLHESARSVFSSLEEDLKKRAESHIHKLLAKLDKKIKATSNILVGRPADKLLADAITNKGAMILVGARRNGDPYLPKGFSTPLSIMNQVIMPVMVIKEGLHLDFNKEPFNILIADDLRSGGNAAVAAGFSLALALKKCRVHHIFIQGATPDIIKTTLQGFASGEIAERYTPKIDHLLKDMQKTLGEHLDKRSSYFRAKLEEVGGTYSKEIIAGPVNETLLRISKQISADLIVFGRHEDIHLKPFGVGEIPLRGMLDHSAAVLIAPEISP